MKILVFSDWFIPGAQAGGPIQSLLAMAENIPHTFYVVTRNTDHGSATPYTNVAVNAWNYGYELPNLNVYYVAEADVNKHLFEEIWKEINPDFIYLNSLWSSLFTQLPLRIAKQHHESHKVICAPRGMLKPEALKIKRTKKKIFLFLARFTGLYKGITWHATSQLEAEEIETYFGTSRIVVARNLSRISTEELPKPNKRSGELTLLTVARISEEKGILEAAEFLSTYHGPGPIHWKIIGFIQDPELAKMCLELLEGTSVRVEFMGHLDTPSIRKEYSKSHVFYLPTRGENYGHAIAEALAGGMPVLISNRTPWRQLQDAQVGMDLPLEEKHFHQGISTYHLMEETEWLGHCRNARKFAIKHVNSTAILEENLNLFSPKN